MPRILLLLFAVLNTTQCISQSFWRIRNERGEELLLTIRTNPANQTFETYTRRNALREMAGSFMYLMAKTTGKIKYPELMHGEGRITSFADTTFYDGKIDYPDKQFQLHAKIWQKNFHGLLTDNRNRTSLLTGERLESDKPLRDYPKLVDCSISLIEQYYIEPELLQTSAWETYKSEVNGMKMKIADDYELAMITMWYGKKLNGIPHDIKKINNRERNPQKKTSALKFPSPGKAVILLNNLPESKSEMETLFQEIIAAKSEILVLEATGNKNLSLQTALLLANHLTAQPDTWGIYLTRKWFETAKNIPNPDQYESMLENPLSMANPTGRISAHKGYYLKTSPAQPRFNGKIQMITDNGTCNMAEALACYLKHSGRARLIGQRTAGSPYLNETFDLDNKYRISIPMAKFYDRDGKTWLGAGVEPDVTVGQEQSPPK